MSGERLEAWLLTVQLYCLVLSADMPPGMQLMVASSPGHSQIVSRSRGEKSGVGLGSLLCHRPEMVDTVSK